MKSLFDALLDGVRHLGVVRGLLGYFDEEERRLVFQSVVIGAAVWLVVFGLKTAVHTVFEFNLHLIEDIHPAFLLVPLLLGAIIVAAIATYKKSTVHYRDEDGHIHELNAIEGDGLERAISLYYSSEPSLEQALTGQEGMDVRWELPTFTLALRKFFATLVTLGSGGSGGLEASVSLIGESMAAGLFKPRRQIEAMQRPELVDKAWGWWQASNADNLQTAQLSGIAAAVSVLLGAPFAAAFFATEVMYRKRPLIEKLVYSLISAMVAYALTAVFGHTQPFEIEHLYVPPSDVGYYGVLLLTAVTVALISHYFKALRATFDNMFHKTEDPYRRHMLGALMTGLIALLVYAIAAYYDLTDHALELVLGSGESVINMAFAGELTIAVALIALSAKLVATLMTVTSGGSAGLLIPSLFFGTMVATVYANLFGYEPMLLIAPAMTASLVAIANVPLAAILFVVEIFGSSYMMPALFMLVVASIFAHEATIYRSQRETFSGRQILPGVSVRRLRIPAAWAQQTLIDLDFRKEYDLNVIGLAERQAENGRSRLHLGSASSTVLEADDVLIVLGRDEKLDLFEEALATMDEAAAE